MKKNFNVEKCVTLHEELLALHFKYKDLDGTGVYTLPAAIGSYKVLLFSVPHDAPVCGTIRLGYMTESGVYEPLYGDYVPSLSAPEEHVKRLVQTLQKCDASKLREAALKEELEDLEEYAQGRILSPEQACRMVELEEELEQELEEFEQELEELDTDHCGWYY